MIASLISIQEMRGLIPDYIFYCKIRDYQCISGGWEFAAGSHVTGELFYLWQDAQARKIEPDTKAAGLQINWLF